MTRMAIQTKICKYCFSEDLEIITGMSIGPVFGTPGTIKSFYISRCKICYHIMNGEEEVEVDGFHPDN
jgi:hypothetical protein